MAVLKLNGLARAALVALALLAASAQAARAKEIYLKCGQTIYTIDLANKTVNNHPATINATAIDWEATNSATMPKGPETAVAHNHIDRTTGTHTLYITVQFPGGSNSGAPVTETCTKTSAPATKF
jgi:hypothetical protein